MLPQFKIVVDGFLRTYSTFKFYYNDISYIINSHLPISSIIFLTLSFKINSHPFFAAGIFIYD